jgi:hypothetical protein
MPDPTQQFSPEVLAQAKLLLEIKERILDVKRNLPNAAYPAQLREVVTQLTHAVELLAFGHVTEAGSNQMMGMIAGAPDGGQRVQIFMPTPSAAIPRPEQPAFEILPAPPAPTPVVTVAPVGGGSLEAAMAALAGRPAPAPAPAPAGPPNGGAPIMGPMPIMRGGPALDPQAAAAMAALANARPAPVAAPTPGLSVEIFPAGDPRAPMPSGG